MNTHIIKTDKITFESNPVLIANDINKLVPGLLSKKEISYIKTQQKNDPLKTFFHFNKLEYHVFVCLNSQPVEDIEYKSIEEWRKLGSKLASVVKAEKINTFCIGVGNIKDTEEYAFLEGFLLGSYSYNKYKPNPKEKIVKLSIQLAGSSLNKASIDCLNIIHESVTIARNWVNEPGSNLTPAAFCKDVSQMFTSVPSVKLDILSPKKIATLKMAGIEAVSKGSENPPAFIVLEYLPKDVKKNKPYVLVGKGIFFDTGGINLKPSAGLADMKCDMSGAAAVAAAIYIIAKMKLKVNVVGLIPATENRPGRLAYLPGDILTMMNGVTVEIKNTDAEGRLILADALCYASRYNPVLTMTIATLTGSAHATFGYHAIAGMQNNAEMPFSILKSASFNVHERIAELPMWNDYEKMIESGVAEIQNVGGKFAGAITAAKFLQKFTDYPFIHLDIAGPAYTESANSYIPAGGTGVGVRLFFEFFNTISKMAK